nr:intestinal mucin-like protein [Danio rerio]|eukprot:XP_021326302.1 intestinal mucin-like protein [Danio rerio]
MSVICEPKKCPDVPPVNCTEPFMVVNVTDPSEPCCSRQVCNCSMCPFSEEKCEVGYELIVHPYGDFCPEIRCESKEVCAYNNTEYKPGSKIHVGPCVKCNCEWDPWTELYQMNCSYEVCPDDECYEGFEYVKQDGECCGTCKLMSCIYYRENNTKHILHVRLTTFLNLVCC